MFEFDSVSTREMLRNGLTAAPLLLKVHSRSSAKGIRNPPFAPVVDIACTHLRLLRSGERVLLVPREGQVSVRRVLEHLAERVRR